jgi:hypothetical protein
VYAVEEIQVLSWRKSSFSAGDGNCVEVAFIASLVAVRDSNNPRGPILALEAGTWRAFVDAIRRDELDLC